MTYEELQKANESIKTTDIKGKEYAEVPQRIKAFRMVFPEGFIDTRIKSNVDGVCVFAAEVGFYENGEKRVLGTGHAYEKEGSTFINKTSYIENCETSAVGRALGMAGFGSWASVASYEEVSNAMLNQSNKPFDPDKAPAHLCADCSNPLNGYKANDGTAVSVEQLRKHTEKKFGRPLCRKCAAAQEAKDARAEREA